MNLLYRMVHCCAQAAVAGSIALIAGCGGAVEEAPRLVAVPTRTPVPVTEDAPEAVDASSRVELLVEPVDAFLTASETAGALDRIDLFREHVLGAGADCFESERWPGSDPLELIRAAGINLVSLDLGRWRDALDAFPAEAARAAVAAGLAGASDLLPAGQPVRACVLPLPPPPVWGAPDEHAADPNSGVYVEVLSGDRLLLTCSAGETCLERLPVEAAYGYGYMVQVARMEDGAANTSLLGFAVFNARAAHLARQVYPDASFPWDGALTPEQESALWARMQDYLASTSEDRVGGRSIQRFLYGSPNAEQYPPYGGLAIGDRIVQSYLARNPDATLEALFELDPAALLAASGYAPGAPQT